MNVTDLKAKGATQLGAPFGLSESPQGRHMIDVGVIRFS
jgi:hypothetical protein